MIYAGLSHVAVTYPNSYVVSGIRFRGSYRVSRFLMYSLAFYGEESKYFLPPPPLRVCLDSFARVFIESYASLLKIFYKKE